MSAPDEVIPTLEDVAAILHERVQAEGGHSATTFSTTTNPTAAQVEAIIDMQVPLALIEFGDVTTEALTCPTADDIQAAIRTLLAMRVAAVVELSYWPQDAVSGDTAEEFWRRIVEIETPKVVAAASECRTGGVVPGDAGDGGGGIAMAPVYQFQAGPRVGSRRW